MNFNKIKAFCRNFRIVLGVILIVAGVILLGKTPYAPWFFLGIVPLIAGLLNFCPLCIITKKCDLPNKE
jgi:hypothetical protein